jgi:hypothetical protein
LGRTAEECVNVLFDFAKKKKEESTSDSSDKEIFAEGKALDEKAVGLHVLTFFLKRRLENKLRNKAHFPRFHPTTKCLDKTASFFPDIIVCSLTPFAFGWW